MVKPLETKCQQIHTCHLLSQPMYPHPDPVEAQSQQNSHKRRA